MDVFPETKVANLVAVSNPDNFDALEGLMLQGRVMAFISYLEPATTHRVFHLPLHEWTGNSLNVNNFKWTQKESKHVKFFNRRVDWEKVSRKLGLNPNRKKKTSDQRLHFKMDNLFLAKQCFTFGLRTVQPGEGHVYQTSDAPMLIYELNRTRAGTSPHQKPILIEKCFVMQDQYFYDLYVMRPNTTYVVPPGTLYLVLTVQKTLFAVDVMDWEVVGNMLDFRTHKSFVLEEYELPPLTRDQLLDAAPAAPLPARPVQEPEEPLERSVISRKRRIAHVQRQLKPLKENAKKPRKTLPADTLPMDTLPADTLPMDTQQAALMEDSVATMPSTPMDMDPLNLFPSEDDIVAFLHSFEGELRVFSQDTTYVANIPPPPLMSYCSVPENPSSAYKPVSYVLPPPPSPQDSYWHTNVPPPSAIDQDIPMPETQSEALDLRTDRSLSAKRCQHALNIVSPLDLRVHTTRCIETL